MKSHCHNFHRGAVTLHDLLMLMLFMVCILGGVVLALRWSAELAWPLRVLCVIVGPVAGLGAGILILFSIALIVWPFEAFGRWWRPYPPPCENGTCGPGDFKRGDFPDSQKEELSYIGWRCRCGLVHDKMPWGMWRTRWVRVMPDGSFRGVLVHGPFGRWREDKDKELFHREDAPEPPSEEVATAWTFIIISALGMAAIALGMIADIESLRAVGAVFFLGGTWFMIVIAAIYAQMVLRRRRGIEAEEADADSEDNFPGWILPPSMAYLIGGTVFLVFLFEQDFDSPWAPWFIGGGTAVGFVAGCIAWAVEAIKNRKKST